MWKEFTLQHVLDCPKGGLIIRRHNEIRNCLGDMAPLVWPQVIRGPVVQEGDPALDDPDLCLTYFRNTGCVKFPLLFSTAER